MEFAMDVKRRYRRYKLYNRSAHPFKIWLMDTGILLIRLLILLVFLAIIAMLLRTTSFGPLGKLFDIGRDNSTAINSPSEPITTTPAAAIIAAKASAPDPVTSLPPTPVIPRISSASQVPAAPEILGPGWLLEQAVGDYTIQFASAADFSKLVDFSNQFAGTDAVTIYPFQRRDNQVVYGLASGIYTDFASARKAINNMPAALRNNQPWIRAIDKLQAEISTFRTQ